MSIAAPTAPEARIEAVDAVRGFALLGVFLVNMLFFATPMDLHFLRPFAEHPHPWLIRAVACLVQGKSYTLFSFLFGLGFALQMERLEARGDDGPRRFRRRLLVLLGLGLVHGVLIWAGDILAVYAVLGFLLLPFRGREHRTVLRWAFGLLGALTFAFLLLGLLFLAYSRMDPAGAAKAALAQRTELETGIRASLQAYAHGPFPALFRQRLLDLGHNYGLTLALSGHLLGMFLLGLWTGRRGVFRDPAAHAPLLGWLSTWGLALGLLMNGLYTWLMGGGMPGPLNPLGLLAMALYLPGSSLLCLAYGAVILRSLTRWPGSWVRHLAAPGRMALTCYLLHAVVFTLVFNAYGLGLYGQVDLPRALFMALGLWLLLIPLCGAWLRHFRLGPAEWLWRSLTYGVRPPFRRTPPHLHPVQSAAPEAEEGP